MNMNTIDFEEKYVDLYYKLQLLQWENYFNNSPHNLNHIDNEIFNICSLYFDNLNGKNRKEVVANLLILRALVDKDTEISNIRNRLDNLENYSVLISQRVDKNSLEYKISLAEKMKEDVLGLMTLRNEVSKKLSGYTYPELVFQTEELPKEIIVHLLNEYVEKNITKVKDFIQKHNMTWDNWFNDLKNIGVYKKNINSLDLVNKLLSILGLNSFNNKLSITTSTDGYTGYAAEITKNHIRMVVSPTDTLYDLTGLFHEFGHVLCYGLNDEEGLYRLLSSSYDEELAVVMEYIAPMLVLGDEEQKALAEIRTLEYTRCALSALYELELWENPKKAEELYLKYYQWLGLDIRNPSLWVLDSFRSIDPVYIQNYVIGAVLAEKLISFLENRFQDNYKAWGKWLYENIYFDGRKRPLIEKVKNILSLS